MVLSMSFRGIADHTLASRTASSLPHHVGAGAGIVLSLIFALAIAATIFPNVISSCCLLGQG
jgi:hypothetical protein